MKRLYISHVVIAGDFTRENHLPTPEFDDIAAGSCRLVLAKTKVAMVRNSNSDPDLRNARRFRDDQPV